MFYCCSELQSNYVVELTSSLPVHSSFLPSSEITVTGFQSQQNSYFFHWKDALLVREVLLSTCCLYCLMNEAVLASGLAE